MKQITNTHITLYLPIASATGETITDITLRVPTRNDLKKAHRHSKDQVEQESFLFALLTGLTVEDIDALSLIDSKQLTDAFRSLSGEPADGSADATERG